MDEITVRLGAQKTKFVAMPLGKEVSMGIHGSVASHYRIDAGDYEPHPTSLDFLVASAVACLTGTLGGRLTAIGQSTSNGELAAVGQGTLETVGGTLVLSAISIEYTLDLDANVSRDEALRVHARHHKFCPVARSIGETVAISSVLTFST